MNHPIVQYELVKLKMAEELRQAEHARQVRLAGSARQARTIDSVRFRERVARLFGAAWPVARGGSATAGA